MRYAHTNLIAKDWQRLSRFYQAVFGCKPVGPKRDLSGEWLERLTGIPGAAIVGEHLVMPGHSDDMPTLEIFSYATAGHADRQINTYGFSHIAFEVADVNQIVDRVVEEDGSVLGEVVTRDYGPLGVGTFAYVKDPEGNFIEVQSWRRA